MSKKYNSRENLFGRALTPYQEIFQMAKDFEPHYQLWTTVNKWFKGSV